MAVSTKGLDAMADALRTATTHLQLHTGNPGAAGTTNATTAARKAATWTDGNDGSFTLAATVSFTGGAASGPCTYVSLWSASTSGNYLGSASLTGDQTFNAAGEYNVTGLTVTGS